MILTGWKGKKRGLEKGGIGGVGAIVTSCTLVFQTPPNNAILQTAIIHRDPDYPWDAHLQSYEKKENKGRKGTGVSR